MRAGGCAHLTERVISSSIRVEMLLAVAVELSDEGRRLPDIRTAAVSDERHFVHIEGCAADELLA